MAGGIKTNRASGYINVTDFNKLTAEEKEEKSNDR